MRTVALVLLFAVWTSCLIAMAQIFRGLQRNKAVYAFVGDVLRLIADLNHADIQSGRYDWQWRYRAYDTVPYDTMVGPVLWPCTRPLTIAEWWGREDFFATRQAEAAS